MIILFLGVRRENTWLTILFIMFGSLVLIEG